MTDRIFRGETYTTINLKKNFEIDCNERRIFS